MNRAKKFLSGALIAVLLLCLFTACGSQDENAAVPVSANEEIIADVQEDVTADASETGVVDIAEGDGDLVPGAPPISTLSLPVASGTDVKKNTKAEVDASNTKDGYVMVRYLTTSTVTLKVLITGPSKVTYTYNLRKDGGYDTFPLSDGNGSYSVGVYKNISGTQYSTEFTTTLNVQLTDQFAPFLRPNQYVNFTANSLCVKKAAEIAGSGTALQKVEKVYSYVIKNFTYDKQLAATVKSGYLPNLDAVWNKKSGICFDYASTMTAMLRSQNVPTKLVIGYTGKAYHAWINVYTPEAGWVESVIYFDGKTWKLMDPTFASSGNSSDSIMKYIGDGKNYTAKYLY